MLCNKCSLVGFEAWNEASDKQLLPAVPDVNGECPACRGLQPPQALVVVKAGPLLTRIPIGEPRLALDLSRWLSGIGFEVQIDTFSATPPERDRNELDRADEYEKVFTTASTELATWDGYACCDLIAFLFSSGRVCPMPDQWVQMHRSLWKAPKPLVSKEWESPPSKKLKRFIRHITFAENMGFLPGIERFLRGLPDEKWLWITGMHQKKARHVEIGD